MHTRGGTWLRGAVTCLFDRSLASLNSGHTDSRAARAPVTPAATATARASWPALGRLAPAAAAAAAAGRQCSGGGGRWQQCWAACRCTSRPHSATLLHGAPWMAGRWQARQVQAQGQRAAVGSHIGAAPPLAQPARQPLLVRWRGPLPAAQSPGLSQAVTPEHILQKCDRGQLPAAPRCRCRCQRPRVQAVRRCQRLLQPVAAPAAEAQRLAVPWLKLPGQSPCCPAAVAAAGGAAAAALPLPPPTAFAAEAASPAGQRQEHSVQPRDLGVRIARAQWHTGATRTCATRFL